MDLKYLHTQDCITVVLDGRPYSVSSHHESFAKVRDLVIRNADPVEVLGVMQAAANVVKAHVAKVMKAQRLTGRLVYEDGMILYDGKPLYNHAVDTLIKFLSLGHDASALAAFIERQQLNPDLEVHDNLYAFLEHGKIPLTPDGHFLAYKAVRADYKDIHSGRFDNAVGAKPRLPSREHVDRNRNQTCSNGLHVCSFGYLPHFAHDNGHVMICKVDPFDVVAIPSDYNNTKMRVVGYEVVGEVTSYYRAGTDVLSQERLAQDRYEVHYEDEGVRDVYDAFYTLDEAKAQADALTEERAWVVDRNNPEVVVYES